MKPVLYLDFDNTIVNSTKRICEMYNEYCSEHPDFIEANWELVTEWDLITQCPLLSKADLMYYFETNIFFYELEMYEGAKEAIKRLSEIYTINMTTIGTVGNLSKKIEYSIESIDGITSYTPINSAYNVDKSHIDMSDGVFVDDNANYLKTSNARYKVAFGKDGDWNEGWKGLKCYDWATLEEKLIELSTKL